MDRRVLASVLAGVLLAGGCSLTRSGGQPSPSPLEEAVESIAPVSGTPTPDPTAAASKTSFVLRLTDQNGLHPPGIPVRVEGPGTGTLVTDDRGEIRLERPGTYRLAIVAGCHELVEVAGGGTGRAGVATGESSEGELAVTWRHRFVPSPPVFTDTSGGWPVGRTVRVRYDVVDRCGGTEGEGASLATFVFETGDNLVLDGAPSLQADDEGYGWVSVRCTAEGEPRLLMRDTRNPPEVLDLAAKLLDIGGPPRCVEA